jgi:hypothetical protein
MKNKIINHLNDAEYLLNSKLHREDGAAIGGMKVIKNIGITGIE